MKISSIKNRALHVLSSDPVLCVSLIAALVSMCFVPPSAAYVSYLDIQTLCLLLSLMLVVAGLRYAGAFDFLVEKMLGLVHNARTLTLLLLMLPFFSSMLITNDVALITFVPLSIMLLTQTGRQDLLIPVIALQTVAANLGSMLTPLGNPQNLYLYSLSGMSAGAFLGVMALPTAVSLLMLLLSTLMIRPEPVSQPKREGLHVMTLSGVLPWLLLFALCLLTVAHVVHHFVALAAVLAGTFVLNRKLLPRADYGLLLTFIFFFIFIGNMKRIPAVSEALSALVMERELLCGVALSQVISNVPAAMLLSGFTKNYSALLLGVNIGGLGTLIASMASLISYKLYAASDGARMGKYLGVFTAINLVFLAVLLGVMGLTGKL